MLSWKLLQEFKARVDRDRSTVKINGSTISDISVDYEYIKKIRATYYLLGALLGKYKHAVAFPGGCNIGSRPIDQHLKGFRATAEQRLRSFTALSWPMRRIFMEAIFSWT